eukprot:g39539.t1
MTERAVCWKAVLTGGWCWLQSGSQLAAPLARPAHMFAKLRKRGSPQKADAESKADKSAQTDSSSIHAEDLHLFEAAANADNNTPNTTRPGMEGTKLTVQGICAQSSEEALMQMRILALKDWMREHQVSAEDCIEKRDLVRAILNSGKLT